MKPKKALAQHFLHEKRFLERIAEDCPIEGEEILEIGAGTGNLTVYLARRGKRVYALEKDPEALEILSSLELPNVSVIKGDALEIPWDFFPQGVCAGNLPYYISSPLLRKFLEHRERFKAGCFLLQWELAEKFTSFQGRKTSPLSLLIYNFYRGKLLFKVPPGAFAPPPKVRSGFVLFERREKPLFGFDLEEMEHFLRLIFSHRRKTIYNNLRGFYSEEEINFLPRNLRPEEASLKDLVEIFRKIKSQQHVK